MDNNSNKRNSGLIALIVIAIIIITVIVIAIVTSTKSSDMGSDTRDSVKDPAESELDKLDTDIMDDITDAIRDVTDALLDEKESNDRITDTDKITDTTETDKTEAESKDTLEIAASLPTEFCLPVTGYIAKEHSIELPVFSLTMNDYRAHNGIDIQAEEGAPVCCFAKGTLSNRYVDPFMGVCLEVTHSGGMVSKYMNLSEESLEGIEVGATLEMGQELGKVGNTAALEASDESHLHFEVAVNGEAVNPMSYIGDIDLGDTMYE